MVGLESSPASNYLFFLDWAKFSTCTKVIEGLPSQLVYDKEEDKKVDQVISQVFIYIYFSNFLKWEFNAYHLSIKENKNLDVFFNTIFIYSLKGRKPPMLHEKSSQKKNVIKFLLSF